MLEKLSTTRSATFFRKKKALPKSLIETIFKEASADRLGNYHSNIVKKKISEPNDCVVSLLIFKFEDEPSFLNGSRLKETKFAFLLIIEDGDLVAVFKKHIFGLEKYFKGYLTKLKYEEIQYLFSDSQPSYEKMALSIMGISRAAILRKTLESTDLTGQLGGQASRRSIPTSTTVRTKEHRHILRPASSSVSKTDSKTNFTDLLSWIADISSEVAKGPKKSDFLDSFAQPVEFDVVQDGIITPNALLVNSTEIKQEINEGAQLYLGDKLLHGRRLHACLDLLDSTLEIHSNSGALEIRLATASGKYLNLGHLKVNKNSITLVSNALRRLRLRTTDGGQLSLQKYFNSSQNFMLTFSSPEYVYLGKRVFRDRGLTSHCKEIEAAIVQKTFAGVITEKGTTTATSRAFPANSIFGFLETNLRSQSSALICDDLGDEWADFIELDTSPHRITLFHCKHGTSTTGASQLHEVVGQALKNLGRVSFNEDEFRGKATSWQNMYSTTNITRIRSSHSGDQIMTVARTLAESHDCRKEICLVVPFLDRIEISAEFVKIQNGQPVRPHIPQLVWLLSAFVSACKESGIRPVIYCS